MSINLSTDNKNEKNWTDLTDMKIRIPKEIKLKELKKSEKNWLKRIEREYNNYGVASDEALEEHKKISMLIKELELELTSTSVFTDQSIQYINHLKTNTDFSISEYCGRFFVDSNRVGLLVDKYNDTVCASIVSEGESCDEISVTDYMDRIRTDTEDAIKFMEILNIGESVFEDDEESALNGLESAHKKHFVNAENKTVLNKMQSVKDAIPVETYTILDTINTYLCGKAKKGTEIWTNKSGFKSLDSNTSDGYPLIKKNTEGEFVFMEKYIVREFSNEILPNTDDGYPVLIGDFKNIVRFAVIADSRHLNDTDLYSMCIKDRRISKEIPLLTTTSNEAYLNCYIAEK